MRNIGLFFIVFVLLLPLAAQEDSLYVTVSSDTATFWHTQTHRNCGSLFVMDVDVDGYQVTVTEVDTGAYAYCHCYFDLSVTFGPLDPGEYTVEVFSTDSLYGTYWGTTSFTIGGVGLVDTANSGCLSARDDSSYISLSVEEDTLTLDWWTPLLNCCLEAEWNGWFSVDTFHVTMTDVGPPCDCECLFELTASFGPFAPGTYTLDFWDGAYGYPTFTIGGMRDSVTVIDQYQSDCHFPSYDGPVWHVSTDGSNETGDGSEEYPFATIQHGIDVAAEGDTVLVLPGTYEEMIDFVGKSIVVISSSGPEETIIDALQEGTTVTFSGGESEATLLQGFTIIGGRGTYFEQMGDYGGGILVLEASPVIRGNVIIENHVSGSCSELGGGIAVLGESEPLIVKNTISGNTVMDVCDCICYFGGGIWIDSVAIPVIGGSPGNGNNIYGNSADLGLQLFRQGGEGVINAQYNYFGSCPPGTYDVYLDSLFDVSNCSDTLLTVTETKPPLPQEIVLYQNLPQPLQSYHNHSV